MTDSLGGLPPSHPIVPLSSNSSKPVAHNDPVDKTISEVIVRKRSGAFLETEAAKPSDLSKNKFAANQSPSGLYQVGVRTLLARDYLMPVALTEDEREAFASSLKAKPEYCVTGLLEMEKGVKLLSEFAFRTGKATNLEFIRLIENFKNSWAQNFPGAPDNDPNRILFGEIFNTYIAKNSPNRLLDISESTINTLKAIEQNPRWAEGKPINKTDLDAAQMEVAKKFGEEFLKTPEIQSLKKELGI